MLVSIPKPKTNVDWEENVFTSPSNAKSLSFNQEPGDMVVKFDAKNPISKQTASCKVKINVKDVAKPTVSYCPQSRSVFLEPGQVKITILLKWGPIIWVTNIYEYCRVHRRYTGVNQISKIT